jgi:hypothetical protein
VRPDLERAGLRVRRHRSKSFLHFHDDPAGIFADLTVGDTFNRYPVNSAKEHKQLLAAIDRLLAG